MGQPLKQGEEAIQQDIMHLERIIRRVLKDPKRPLPSRNRLLKLLKGAVTELHNGERADKPLRRTG